MKYHYTPIQIQKKEKIQHLQKHGYLSALHETLTKKIGFSLEMQAKMESEIKARIVFPWDKDYEEDRKDFNNIYPAFPIAIVYVANIPDIRDSLSFAQKNDIQVCIRSGGHSLASFSVCDGIIIDISGMKSVSIHPVEKFAVVEAGNTFGDLNPKFELHGLHLPGGGCPTVSVAGYMQGGGYGITSRKFGINCDCVLEVTVMLADGSIVVANRYQNVDLFWAIRGGTGGNFGVLLSIKYQLFELGNIWGIQISWNFDDDNTNAANALVAIQNNYLAGFQHPNLGIETVLCRELGNKGEIGPRKVYFCASFIGTEEELDKTVAPLMVIPGATVVSKQQGPYSKINGLLLEGIPNLPMDVQAYSRSIYIARELSATDYSNILDFFKTAPNQYTMVDMEGYGGAIRKVPVDDSAFIHRDVLMDFFCDAFFNNETNDQKENEVWINSFFEFMEQYGNGHSYQNYPNRDQKDFRWAYWGSYYNQLVAIKEKYDPGNFFRYQQSIGPKIESQYADQQTMLFTPKDIKNENY